MENTKSKTVFGIVIPDSNGLEVNLVFRQSAPHCVWVDWGDGSYPDSFAEENLVEAKHSYVTKGAYSITMHAVDEGTITLGGGWTGSNIVGGDNEATARMLVSAEIGEDVTEIAAYAFRGCENLGTLIFHDNGDMRIGAYAFEGCCSLEQVHIPANNAVISNGAFCNCSGLKTVELPKGVYEIEKLAFYGCDHLESISLDEVTKIDDYAFSGCRKLKEIVLGNNAFSIGQEAFNGCSSARNVNLGAAKSIGELAFFNCKSIPELTIPYTVGTIGQGAFMRCSSLEKITVDSRKPPVLEAQNVFADANEKRKIVVPYSSMETYKSATNWCFYESIIEGE